MVERGDNRAHAPHRSTGAAGGTDDDQQRQSRSREPLPTGGAKAAGPTPVPEAPAGVDDPSLVRAGGHGSIGAGSAAAA